MDNYYIQEMQQDMAKVFKDELASGKNIYEIYAKYRNLVIEITYGDQDPDEIMRYQFICDLAKHMITEKSMEEKGFEKKGSLRLWQKKTDSNYLDISTENA